MGSIDLLDIVPLICWPHHACSCQLWKLRVQLDGRWESNGCWVQIAAQRGWPHAAGTLTCADDTCGGICAMQCSCNIPACPLEASGDGWIYWAPFYQRLEATSSNGLLLFQLLTSNHEFYLFARCNVLSLHAGASDSAHAPGPDRLADRQRTSSAGPSMPPSAPSSHAGQGMHSPLGNCKYRHSACQRTRGCSLRLTCPSLPSPA